MLTIILTIFISIMVTTFLGECLSASNVIKGIVIGLFWGVIFAALIGQSLPTRQADEVCEVKSLYPIHKEQNGNIAYYLRMRCGCDKSVIYKTDGETGKTIETSPEEKYSINEGEYEEAYLEIHKGKFEDDCSWLLGIDLNFLFDKHNHYVFYVPDGSVVFE